jgi:type IV pilus assembly protein PilE
MQQTPRPAAGFTLVELSIVLAVAGVLAALSWPPLQQQLQRSRRADAVAALLRVQLAQESHRAHHGLYAARLSALNGAASPRSREGLYDIELVHSAGNAYTVLATARSDGAAAADRDCARLSLQVRDGLADMAPSARCWNH